MTSRGPADPGRRDRIVQATYELLADRGLPAVTHRTVARAAGVPLGSTTYYFDSLDDLLSGVLEMLVDEYEQTVRTWARRLCGSTREELARAVTNLVVEYAAGKHARARVEYQLYLAAIDRPHLRPLAARYTAVNVDTLSMVVDRPTAVALSAAVDGATIRALVSPEPPDRDELEAAFAAICTTS